MEEHSTGRPLAAGSPGGRLRAPADFQAARGPRSIRSTESNPPHRHGFGAVRGFSPLFLVVQEKQQEAEGLKLGGACSFFAGFPRFAGKPTGSRRPTFFEGLPLC